MMKHENQKCRVGVFGQFDTLLYDQLCDVDVVFPLVSNEVPVDLLSGLDGIIVRSPYRLTSSHARQANRLKWIIRAGSGTDNIAADFQARGVTVTTTPTNSHAVAELAIGLALGLLRNISAAHESLRLGQWRKQDYVGRELRSQTVGLLGFGKIGQEIGSLIRDFGANILLCDRSPEKPIKRELARRLGASFVDFDELVAASDLIVAALPSNADTKHLFRQQQFNAMKSGAMIINVGRGSLIDLDDLAYALQSGQLGGAALDVFPVEPPGPLRLFDLPNVLCTPHLGAQTHETHRDIAMAVVRRFKELHVAQKLSVMDVVHQ